MGFAYKIYLSHVVTTEVLGLYSIVLSIFMVFITIVSAGIPIAISKITASNKVSNNYLNTYSLVRCGLNLEIVVSIFLALIIIIFKGLFVNILGSLNSYYLLLVLIPAIISQGIYSPFKGYLWGKEHYIKVSLVELFEQIIKIATLFILVKFSIDMTTLLPLGIAISVAGVLSTLIGIIYFFESKGRLSRKELTYKPIIKSALPLTTTRFCSSLMQPIISVLLPLRLVATGYTKSQALSMLGIAMGMTFPILTIPSTLIGSLSMALIPEIASLLKEDNSSTLSKQINSSLLFTMCCSFVCFIVILPLAYPICELLFNNIDAGLYLTYASWTIIPSGLTAITTSILNSIGCEKYTFRYFIYSAILSILIIIFLPKFVGIHALFLSSGLAMLLTFLLNIRKINKSLHIKQNYISNLIKLIFVTIPSTLLIRWLYNIFVLMYGNILALILSALIGCIAFVLLIISINIIDINIILTSIKKQNSKRSKNIPQISKNVDKKKV